MEFEAKGKIHWLIENLETNGNDSCTSLRNVKQTTLWTIFMAYVTQFMFT